MAFCVQLCVCVFLRPKEWQADLTKPYKLTTWFILTADEWIWQISLQLYKYLQTTSSLWWSSGSGAGGFLFESGHRYKEERSRRVRFTPISSTDREMTLTLHLDAFKGPLNTKHVLLLLWWEVNDKRRFFFLSKLLFVSEAQWRWYYSFVVLTTQFEDFSRCQRSSVLRRQRACVWK